MQGPANRGNSIVQRIGDVELAIVVMVSATTPAQRNSGGPDDQSCRVSAFREPRADHRKRLKHGDPARELNIYPHDSALFDHLAVGGDCAI